MAPTLRRDETVLWEGRATPSIRGAFVAVVFLGLYLWLYLVLDNIILAFFALFFFVASTILTLVGFISATNTRYYITNQRIVREQEAVSKRSGELPIELLDTVRVSHGILSGARGVGAVYFDSHSGHGLVFPRVKNPEAIKQAAIDAKARLPILPPSQPTADQPFIREREIITREILIQCRSCGARYLQGTPKCLTCGAPL